MMVDAPLPSGVVSCPRAPPAGGVHTLVNRQHGKGTTMTTPTTAPRTGIVRSTPLGTAAVACEHCSNTATCLVYPVGCSARAVCEPCRTSRYQSIGS
jgi:hypothetical protein